ncbi:MAG: uroporphyrinogen decarboxylase family protein [bacterium]
MNGRERIITALEIREADRVPLYIHGINEEPIIGIGRHLTDGLPDPKKFHEMTDSEKMKLLDTLFLIHEAFEVDGMTSFEIGHEEILDDKTLRDDWGVIYTRNPHGLPVATGHPLQSAADLAAYAPPEPKAAHLLLLNLARERFESTKALFWMMRGSFVLGWRLAGMTNLMMKMVDDPGFVHRLAEMTVNFNLQQLELLAAAGVDVLVIEDDIAHGSSTMISPAHFAEYVNPYNRRVVKRAHELGLKVVRHSDGNLWKILDLLIETGYDGLNPLEPEADMGLKKVKDYCGDRLCLLGNIDCKELLCEGTPEAVAQAVRQAIEDAGKGGGLIICSSNSLHPGVNPENCIAMFEATKKYGVYTGH